MNQDAGKRPIKRALLSVFNKDGLLELATALHQAGAEIVSTGSTAAVIRDNGIPVTEVQEVTGFPEILDGRVKTLHPAVHGGLLADRTKPSHEAALQEHGIDPFDLVVVNLYPFEETVADGGSFDEIIEKIDIGGPAMVRSAAKNFSTCAVIVENEHYQLAAQAALNGGFTKNERQALSALAFSRIADYDLAINEWTLEQSFEYVEELMGPFAEVDTEEAGVEEIDSDLEKLYETDRLAFEQEITNRMFSMGEQEQEDLGITYLRYGENSHQRAYVQETVAAYEGEIPLGMAPLLSGKAMSYNNYVDADAALRAAYDHEEPAVAIIKHNNPCGIATCTEDEDIEVAYSKAHATDPLSAFGGVIAVNRPVSLAMAEKVKDVFTEVIVAPGFEAGALELLSQKKNVRLLEIAGKPREYELVESRVIWGGQLIQEVDSFQADGDNPENWELVTGEAASAEVLADLAFAWKAVRAPKSNAILLAKDGAAVGIGMGQVNRVDSCKLAIERANTLADGQERARGAVCASDAFFPFADGPQLLIDAGVTAIVQPGGSIRDAEVIEACKAAGVTMYFTGTRHFAH